MAHNYVPVTPYKMLCDPLIKLCVKNIIYEQNYHVELIFPFQVMYIIEAVAQQP